MAARGLGCIRGERRIFANLSFSLHPGEARLLIGPNGSGKTSLLRVLALLSPPATGEILLKGEPAQDDPEEYAGAVRYLGHADAIKPVLSVRENVSFWARLLNGTEAHVEDALERFDLKALADLPGRMLSAGQKRRTNLARLVAAPAPIWLLDEPTTALDRKSIGLLEGELARHRAEGGCVMLSTHQAVALPGAEDLDMSLYSLTGEAAYAVLSDLDGPSREPSRDDGFDDQDDDEDAQGWEALR